TVIIIKSTIIVTTIAEMTILGKKGAKIAINNESNPNEIRLDRFLFSETSGFIIEISKDELDDITNIAHEYKIPISKIGEITSDELIVNDKINININELENIWRNSFAEVLK
ncbi:MAG: hypothetical protein ACOC2U_05025, partial [bacterium]